MAPYRNQVAAVPDLSIMNVPEDVVARLRKRARANHRSLQGELLALACRAAQTSDTAAARNEQSRRKSAGHRTIEQIVAEHRERHPLPVADAPSAAELIRSERDAR